MNDKVEQIKQAISIEDVIGQAVQLKKNGREFIARCPFHNERTPSFTVSVDKQFYHCFGCGAHGDVIAFVMHHEGVDFKTACEQLEARKGLTPKTVAAVPRNTEHEASLHGAAMRVWRESRPSEGTLVERYLAGRGVGFGIECQDIRFHAACPFGKTPDGTQRYVPAMIALVRDPGTRDPMGIHRTELTVDGGKVDRKMLGPCHGGAVLLAPHSPDQGIGIAEGIETSLAVMELGGGPVWATLSSGSLARFPLLGGISKLAIFADNDAAGIKAARDCASRWARAGFEATIHAPDQRGQDFADVLAARKEGVAA